MPHVNYVAILPELILIAGALVLLLCGQFAVAKVPTAFYSVGAALISAGALAASLVLWHDVQARGPFTSIADSVAVDGFAIAFLVLVSCILLVSTAVGHDFLVREGAQGPEYYVLALLAGSGAMLMASANDLILIFVALEIMSIPLYVLAGSDLRRRESGEAAIKYFLLGAFSSAIFVYGIALVYGATGSTNLPQIASYLSQNIVTSNGVLLAGLGLLLVGFGFKISAVPFHMWAPDVYQGSPTPVTGFMTAIAKAGGFAALLRVFFSTFGVLRTDWQPMLWVIAILTLLVGAILGLVQHDVKRMLAYSSINHAGFILVGLAAATTQGIAGSVYYVFIYAFLVLGSFPCWLDGGHQPRSRCLSRAFKAPAAAGSGLCSALVGPSRDSLHHGLHGEAVRDLSGCEGPLLCAGHRRHAVGGDSGSVLSAAHLPHVRGAFAGDQQR
jgi:NADH-quinone oxidoreductase subunit N